MERQRVEILIDTGIRGPRRRTGKAGYILVYRTDKGNVDKTSITTHEDETENESLIKSLLKALESLKKPAHLDIYTDSKYITTALTEWIIQWEISGWVNKRGNPVAPEWRSIKYLLNEHEYEVVLNGKNEYRNWLRNEVSK